MSSAPIFSDAKLNFLKSRYLETFLGGIKFSTEDKKITSLDNVIQFVFYLGPPLIIILIPLFIDDYYLSLNVSAGVNTLLNLILMVIMRIFFTTISGKVNPNTSEEDVLYQNKRSYNLFVYKGFSKMMASLMLTYFFSFVSGSNIYKIYRSEEDFSVIVVKIVISSFVILLGCYSLYFDVESEPSTTLADNDEFSIFSLFYSRPLYSIFILIIKFIYDNDSELGTVANLNIILIFYFLLIWFWWNGSLGGIYSTFSWLLEYINIVLFGDSTKASDLRLFLSIAFNIIACILSTLVFLGDQIQDHHKIFVCMILLTFFTFSSCNNILGGIHLTNKQMKISNEFKVIHYLKLFSIFILLFGVCIGLTLGYGDIYKQALVDSNFYNDSRYRNFIVIVGCLLLLFGVFNLFAHLFQADILLLVK